MKLVNIGVTKESDCTYINITQVRAAVYFPATTQIKNPQVQIITDSQNPITVENLSFEDIIYQFKLVELPCANGGLKGRREAVNPDHVRCVDVRPYWPLSTERHEEVVVVMDSNYWVLCPPTSLTWVLEILGTATTSQY